MKPEDKRKLELIGQMTHRFSLERQMKELTELTSLSPQTLYKASSEEPFNQSRRKVSPYYAPTIVLHSGNTSTKLRMIALKKLTFC